MKNVIFGVLMMFSVSVMADDLVCYDAKTNEKAFEAVFDRTSKIFMVNSASFQLADTSSNEWVYADGKTNLVHAYVFGRNIWNIRSNLPPKTNSFFDAIQYINLIKYVCFS